MFKYKVINLPLNEVITMANRLNEVATDGWDVSHVFQSGQNAVCILKKELPSTYVPPKKNSPNKTVEGFDILSGVQ